MLVVYGASGHGKVVADAARAAGLVVDGFLDDDETKHGTMFFGAPVLGGRGYLDAAPPLCIAWGIGSNRVREQVAAIVTAAGHTCETVIHPRAVVAPSARIGAGVVVFAGACINADAVVDDGAIVNTSAVIEHDCVLGAFCHVSPNAALGGAVRVGVRAHVGLGSSVIQGIAIGDDTTIGAGSVVVRDLPPGVVAYGVPARARR